MSASNDPQRRGTPIFQNDAIQSEFGFLPFEAAAGNIYDVAVNETPISVTDALGPLDLSFSRSFSDTVTVTDSVSVDDVTISEVISITDTLLTTTSYHRILSDTIVIADQTVGQAVNVETEDSLSFVTDYAKVEAYSVGPVVMDPDGLGGTVPFPEEVRYDRIEDSGNFIFKPFPQEGVPFQALYVVPIVKVHQQGSHGASVSDGVDAQNFFSPVFRITGLTTIAPTVVSVVGRNVTITDQSTVSDSFLIEVFGAHSAQRASGFVSGDQDGYIEILNGRAPGIYRIVDVIDTTHLKLDRPLPLVDVDNGNLSWRFTSAVQSFHFRTNTKITDQSNYVLRAHNLITRAGLPYQYSVNIYTAGIDHPRVIAASITDEGHCLVQYDQAMQVDPAFVLPSEYTFTGPSQVRVLKAWSYSPTQVALELQGLQAGSYTLQVNFSGTPKDLAGNPIDPVYSQAVFTGSIPLTTRSIFTDRGPIAKPGLTIQSGSGALVDGIASVLLPGSSLNTSHIGHYVRLGQMGQAPTSSSSVSGSFVTIIDTITAPDSLKVELVGASSTSTVYSSLNGIFRVDGILTGTRAKLQASFSLPAAAYGLLYWELINPRNGEIADDPTDVQVKINGLVVTPQAVVGLLGQVILPTIPNPSDDVKVDYSWVCNPTVEVRRLNSREFRLNAWNVASSAGPSQHQYRYNNTLIVPSDYEPLDMLATLDQPQNRELHYRAYERAYTPVLNDPTLLLLNSPIHKIAFPAPQRTLSEEFVFYEGTALPENETNPWAKHGAGSASVSAGVLTVIDNVSGPFPYGQPIFWTQDLDLTFSHTFAMSWRFLISSVTVPDGVFSGVSAGYTDESAAYVVGFLTVAGVNKIGILKRGAGDRPDLISSWTGGLDSVGSPTLAPANFDWDILHSYRIFRDLNGVIRVFVDGDITETLRILPNEAPFLEELAAPFDEIQGAFFGSISRPSENQSQWDFVRFLILPTNPLQSSPSSFVSYEGTVPPEVDGRPWTPIGFHGHETILSNSFLLLDSTSATDPSTEAQVGLMGGDFRGFVRMEPLLTAASQVVIDVQVQLLTHTHGLDPYGLTFAVDDGNHLIQVAFLADRPTPKLSYGGRSSPENFSPYIWTALGGAGASMEGRTLVINDTIAGDGKVYFIEDLSPPLSDARVVGATTDYFMEFQNRVVTYTADGSGFAGAFGQVFDGSRIVGVMLSVVAGVKKVQLHSDGVPVQTFTFNWGDGLAHTYRIAKSTAGDLVSLFVDGTFIGSSAYSSFTASSGDGMVSFGSSTPASSLALSKVEWSYCNAWRTRSDLKRYIGIWKGYDNQALTGYHLPLKVSGRNATISGNALGDTLANYIVQGCVAGDHLVVDSGPNKGVYEVAGVGSATSLTILGTWPLNPSQVDYRIVRETDWATSHKYRLNRDSTGDVALLFESLSDPLIRIGYNSIDLPNSGVGKIKTLTNGLPAIAFGSFSAENLEQSSWDHVRYGITRNATELKQAPHHQVLNRWNVMQSPERLYTTLSHEITDFKSSSTGVIPKKSPDFLADPGLLAFTQLNDSTPLVPSTQTFQVRAPFATQTYISTLNNPDDVLNNSGSFTLNDGTIRYQLVVPDDVLYSSLEVIEQSTGDPGLLTPFGDCCGPSFSGLNYTGESCLIYTGQVIPELDTSAPTPWSRQSDVPPDVFASVAGGVLTFGSVGSRTVYKNNTTLPDAPGLQTEAKFKLRLRDDSTLGTGDTQVRFGMSCPGLTIGLAFVTTVLGDRYVYIFDLNNGNQLGAISFDFLDGVFHTYHIVRNPGNGIIRVFIDTDVVSSRDIALLTDRPYVTDNLLVESL